MRRMTVTVRTARVGSNAASKDCAFASLALASLVAEPSWATLRPVMAAGEADRGDG